MFQGWGIFTNTHIERISGHTVEKNKKLPEDYIRYHVICIERMVGIAPCKWIEKRTINICPKLLMEVTAEKVRNMQQCWKLFGLCSMSLFICLILYNEDTFLHFFGNTTRFKWLEDNKDVGVHVLLKRKMAHSMTKAPFGGSQRNRKERPRVWGGQESFPRRGQWAKV